MRYVRPGRAEDPAQLGIGKVDLRLARFAGRAGNPKFTAAIDRLLDARLGHMADRDWSRRVLEELERDG